MAGYDIVVLKSDGTEYRLMIERSVYHIGEKDCDINCPKSGFNGYGLMVKVAGSVFITPGDKQTVTLNGLSKNGVFEIGLGDVVGLGELAIQVVPHGQAVKSIFIQTPTEAMKPVEKSEFNPPEHKPAVTSTLSTTPQTPQKSVSTPIQESPIKQTKEKPSTLQSPKEKEVEADSETEDPLHRSAPPAISMINVTPVVRKKEAWESAVSAVHKVTSYEKPGIETQRLSKHSVNTQNMVNCENCGKPIRPIVLRCPHCKTDRTDYVDQAFSKL